MKTFSKLFLELLIWFFPPTLFLIKYTTSYAGGFSTFFMHYKYILLFYTVLVCIKFISKIMLFYCKSNILKIMLDWVASLYSGTILLIIWVYYIVILIGIHFCGDVLSYSILSHYALRINEINGFYFLTKNITLIIFGFFCLVNSLVFFKIKENINWIDQIFKKTPVNIYPYLFLILVMVIYKVSYPMAFYNVYEKEPFSMTFLVNRNHDLEGHFINEFWAQKIDSLAVKERLREQKDEDFNKKITNKINFVFIVVDALRADHMSLYGYNRTTTPNLDALFKNGNMRVIKNVHSTCSDSACGLLSMISSKYVPQFSFSPITLHEVLEKEGYTVNLILSGDHTNFFNLNQYYGQTNSFFDGSMSKDYRTNDDQMVVEKLKDYPNWDGKPLFLQLHLMSSHVMRDRKYYHNKYEPDLNYVYGFNQDEKNYDLFKNFYDNGVLYSDEFIGKILELLKKKNYLNNTLVVIVGDHGDGMGEHELYTHANSIYEEMTHIPMVLINYNSIPKFKEQVNPYPGQVDMAPTILNELNLPFPKTWYGLPIGDKKQNSLLYLEERKNYGVIAKDVLPFPLKYWINDETKEEQAYNLKDDPYEEKNIATKLSPKLVEKLKENILSQNSEPRLPE